MAAQATTATDRELTEALSRAQADHERAGREHEEADLAYRRLSGLAHPTVLADARQRRTEAAGILRTAGERLAAARAALAQHRAAERQRQRQATDEQPRNREAERRVAEASAFERWRREQV